MTMSFSSTNPADGKEAAFLEVDGLSVSFASAGSFLGNKQVQVIHDVSFKVSRASCFAVVGESGSGKTTLARSLVGLVRPTQGQIRLNGEDISDLSPRGLRDLRRRVQLVLQDPRASIDPRMTIYDVLREALVVHRISNDRSDQRRRIFDTIGKVGLQQFHLTRYGHELSGGQRQRVAIARALICEPEILILDEPVSALDVSIQAQIINLLADLKDSLGLTYILISHDLALVRYFSDMTGVMYLGRFVELGTTRQICSRPEHPYTDSLLALVASDDPVHEKQRDIQILEGNPPSPLSVPSGCVFHTRCPKARHLAALTQQGAKTVPGASIPSACEDLPPELKRRDSSSLTACHYPLADDVAVRKPDFPQ